MSARKHKIFVELSSAAEFLKAVRAHGEQKTLIYEVENIYAIRIVDDKYAYFDEADPNFPTGKSVLLAVLPEVILAALVPVNDVPKNLVVKAKQTSVRW